MGWGNLAQCQQGCWLAGVFEGEYSSDFMSFAFVYIWMNRGACRVALL